MGEYNGVIGGVSGIVTDGFTPWWHAYDGTVEAIIADENLTTDDAYDKALNWQVEARALSYEASDGQVIEDLDHCAIVRADNDRLLGIHSDTYGITQNDELRKLGNAIKGAGYTVYAKSAGSLYGDKVTWMLVKLGEDKSFDGEHLQSYLLLASSHDGSLPLSARPTNVRVECMNTFDWAIKGTKSLVNIRHTRNAADYVAAAEHTLSVAYNHFNAMDAEIQQLLDKPYTHDQYRDELVPVLVGEQPTDEGRSQTIWHNKRDALLLSPQRDDQANINGTAWGAVMAVNSYELWGATVKGGRLASQAKKAINGTFPMTEVARSVVLAA
jgi:phage/plasmid-like protein (TIGR03299 family)